MGSISAAVLVGMINPNLDAGFPCLLSIFASSGAGHEIIADGYGYDSSTLYHHLNLGWSGSYNAWYNLPNFSAGGYNWQTVAFCIYNVYPTSSGEIVSGRVTDSTGVAISGVTVTATRAQGGVYTATTNANGIYAFANVPSASSYSLTAAKTGYTFLPQNVSTGTSTNYNMTSGDVWGANFTATIGATTWTLTVNSSPAQGAAVTGTHPGTTNYSIPSVVDGTAVSLTAPATFVSGGTTYNFIQWTAPGGWTVSGATVSGNIHSNTTLEADYAAQVWTLTVNSAPIQGVGITGTYPGTTNYSASGVTDGTAVNLTAPAGDPAGYTFSQWTVNGVAQPSGQKSITFTVTAATTAAAQYTVNTYTLSVQSTPPTGLSIGSSTADGGTTNYTVSAVAYGTSVNLQAPAADPAGYTFSQWTVNGTPYLTKSITFTVTAATTAVAQYTLNNYTLNVQSTPPTGLVIGSSTADGGTTNYTVSAVAYGTSVNLAAPATDPAGYTFLQWTVNGTPYITKSITFTVTAATTAVAQYTLNTYTLSVQSTPPTGLVIGSSTADGGTTNYTVSNVAYGTSVNLAAPVTDPAGYTFSQWTLNGVVQPSGQKSITFTVTAATTAVAQYTLNNDTLSVQSTPPSGLSISSSTADGGTTNYAVSAVAYGTSVNLQAPAADPAGYTFSQWTVNGAAQASGQKAITFTMTAATTAAAQYTSSTYTLNVQSTPPTGLVIGSSTADGGTTNYTVSTVAYGTSVNLQAPAADPAGCTFSQWTLNGVAQPSGQKSITFTVTSATTAVAQYTLNNYTLSVQSTPPTGLSISSSTGDGGTTNYAMSAVAYGTSVNLQAPAADPAGYTFSQWTLNGVAQPSGQKSITFTVTAATTAVAQYRVSTYTLSVQSTPATGIVITSSTGNNGTTNYTAPGITYGTSVNLVAPATDPTGYTFSQWTVNGAAQASGQKAITFTMSTATTTVAQYLMNSCTLSVQSTPATGIVITSSRGDGGKTNYTVSTVAYGTSANLVAPATDPTGYTFSRWTVNGTSYTMKSITFTVTADTTAVVQYTLNNYTLNVQSTPPAALVIGSSTADGGTTNYTVATVAYGTSVNLAAPATDPAGYTFSQWTVNGTPYATKSITFTVPGATTALAQYTLNNYTLNVQSTPPAGLVIASSTADGGTTNYTVSTVAYGTSVNLQAPATDPAGYTFSRWTLNGVAQPSGQKSITLTVTAATTAVAQYTLNTYTLSVQSTPPTGLVIGSSTADGGTTNYAVSPVAYGTSVNLVAPATDPTGYTFSQWMVNGAAQASGQKAITFTVTGATTALAQYTVNTYALSVQSTPPGGLVITSGTGNNGTANYTNTVAYGTSVNLQAPAADPAGYTFLGWTVNGTPDTAKSVTFMVTAPTTAVAQYTLNDYTLNVQSTPPAALGIGSSTGDSGTTDYAIPLVAYGTSVNLQAPAADPAGYTFSQWTLNGVAQPSGQKSITFTVTAATTAVAQYTLNTSTLSVQSTPPSGLSIGSSSAHGGTTNYANIAAYGTSVNLQAPAIDPTGYAFSQWTANGARYTTKSITFTVTADTTAVAQYTAIYTLTVQSENPVSGVSIAVSPADNSGLSNGTTGTPPLTRTYNAGTSVTLTAPLAASGNNFQKWQQNGNDYSTNPTITVKAGNDTYTAVYLTPTARYMLTVQSTPPTGLSVGSSTGHNGTTNYTKTGVGNGTSVNLQAPVTDPAGYSFSQWTVNGAAQTPGQKSITFTMDAAVKAVARYTSNIGYTLSVQSTPPGKLVISSSTGQSGKTNYKKTQIAYGTSVNLQAPATDPAGYTFSHWTVNSAAQTPGQKSITFTMAVAVTAVAQYTPNAGYTLSVHPRRRRGTLSIRARSTAA